MRKLALLIGSLSLLLLACEPEPVGPVVDDTPYIYEVPAGFPIPVEPAENPLTVAKVALGKRLFYDPILSADETISCNSCHRQEFAFADNVAISPGVAGRLGIRNAPSLANLAYVTVFHKDGGVPNTIHLGVLLIWQKQAGEWKLLARQAFKYPPQAQ